MKLSLATKIFLGFSALLGIFGLLALLSVQEIRAVAEDLRAIKDGHLALTSLAAQLETHQQNRFRDLRRALDEKDPNSRLIVLRIVGAYFPQVIRSTTDEIRNVASRQLALAETQNGDTAHQRVTFYSGFADRLDRIAVHHEAIDELTRNVESFGAQEVDLSEARADLERIETRLRSEMYQLNKHLGDATDRIVKRAEEDESNTILRVAITSLVALAVGLFLMLLAARALSPIRRLVLYARAISRGDYEQTIEIGDNELSSLADELRQMARSRKDREEELDRQAAELEEAYRRVEDLKRYHESIVRSLRTGVVVTDRALSVTSTNRAAASQWGLEGVEGTSFLDTEVGRALAERLGPITAERTDIITTSALPLGDRLADVTVAPLVNERGAALGLVVALEDVTEAVRTKEALIRSERLATIGRMSAHVTHEIRNPLSSIGLNAEMLEDLAERAAGADAEEARAMCRSIAREVDRLTAITEAYLKFARLPRPELSDEDVTAWLSTITAFVRRDLDAAGVELDLCLPSPSPVVRIDPDQMRQAILNLVRNAKEAMPEGGRVKLSAEAHDRVLEIRIADEGVGIPADHLERVFDPFYSTKLTGTGLGLALTQQIVQEHGGRLTLRSEIGRGTEFTITLPLEQGPEMTRVVESESEDRARAS